VPYLCIIGRGEKGGFFTVRNRPDPEEWFFDEAEPWDMDFPLPFD
jgi:hypothetical protein